MLFYPSVCLCMLPDKNKLCELKMFETRILVEIENREHKTYIEREIEREWGKMNWKFSESGIEVFFFGWLLMWSNCELKIWLYWKAGMKERERERETMIMLNEKKIWKKPDSLILILINDIEPKTKQRNLSTKNWIERKRSEWEIISSNNSSSHIRNDQYWNGHLMVRNGFPIFRANDDKPN